MCRSQWMSPGPAGARGSRGCPSGSWRRADEAPVDVLDLVGHLGPGPALAAVAAAAAASRARRRSSPAEPRRAGRRASARRPAGTAARARRRRPARGRPRGPRRPGRRRRRAPAAAAAGARSAPRRRPGRRCRRRRGTPRARRRAAAPGVSRSRSRLLTRASGSVGPSNQIDGLPVELVGEGGGARAGSSRSAPRSSSAHVDDPQPARRRGGAAPARRRRRRAASARYGPREEALQQLPGGVVARGAGVDAAEEHLDERPRATWVERTRSTGSWKVATLSETEWRSAADPVLGANGSWTWTTSSGTAPRSCSSARLTSTGIGAGPPPRPARQRDALADGEHARPLAPEQALGVLDRVADQPAATLADRAPRRRTARDDRTRCPRSASSSEVRVDERGLISCREPHA